MNCSKQILQRLLNEPGRWVHIKKSTDNRPRREHVKERREIFKEIISILKVMQIPYKIRDKTTYVIMTLKTGDTHE